MKQTMATVGIAIFAASLMMSTTAPAQLPGAVKENARVRVIDRSCPCPPRHGRVLTSWGDSALVDLDPVASAKPDTAAAISAFHISNLLVSLGYETQILHGMKNGAMYGTLAGAALGLALGSPRCSPREYCFSRWEVAGFVAVPGLLLGTAIGFFSGARERERWVPATGGQRLGMSISPSAYPHGVAVVGTLEF